MAAPRLLLLLLLVVSLPFALPFVSAEAVGFGPVQTLETGLTDVSSLTFGPEDPDPASVADGCIYAVTAGSGEVHRICFDATKTVTSSAVILDLNGGSSVNNALGVTFEPLSDPSGAMFLYLAYSLSSVDPFNGRIARAVSSDGGATWVFDDGFAGDGQLFITGLGRSSFDHQTNGLDFGTDGCLYIAQGGNSNAGYDPDHAESRLSSAILRACFSDGNGGVSASFDRDCGDGTLQEACDVEVYASGMRNPYDLGWHSNGRLYATDNDINANFRDDCGQNANTFGCPCQEVNTDPDDELNLVLPGRYYGSPNPYMANPTGLQCQGTADAGSACVNDSDCMGAVLGSCQDLSALCTDPLCGNDGLGAADPGNVQCLYVGTGEDPLIGDPGLDPDGLYMPPLFNSGLLDGMVEYRTPLDWDGLGLGAFCSDWHGDIIMTPAGGNEFRRARPSNDGLTATFEGTTNLANLRGLDVTVGPDGTIYGATLFVNSIEYQVPTAQPDTGLADFFVLCSPGQRCNETAQTCVAVLPIPVVSPAALVILAGLLLLSLGRRVPLSIGH